MPVVIWRKRDSCSPTVPCQEEAQMFVSYPPEECRDGVFLRMLWKMVCRRSSTQVVAALLVSGESCCVRRYTTNLLGTIRRHCFLISWDDRSLLAFHPESCGFLAYSGSSLRARPHLALDRYPRPSRTWGLAWGAFKQIQMPGFTPSVSDETELEQSLGSCSKNLVSAMCHRGWEALSWWLNLCERVNQRESLC